MKMTIFAGLLATTLFVLNSCSENVQYEQPSQLITHDLAVELSERYHESRAELISKSILKDDVTAVWYSIEELENYLNYVKNQGAEKGIDVTGIRLYLGVYPNDSSYKEKAGLTTIFLTPTKKREATINVESSRTDQYSEENIDAIELQPLNYGGIGRPPRVMYPQ